MGLRALYARHLFPRFMEWAIGGEAQLEERRIALAEARGRVLELGFGTGLNLPCYPPAVERLVASDPERVLERRVERRISAAGFPVLRVRSDGARLPCPDRTFDTVASTWTLCTIAEPVTALREARRVLAPGGRFLFMEHGRSDDPAVARWQEWLNPVERAVACGCNLDRPIDGLIRQAGLQILRLERFVMPRTPRILGEIYRGAAARATEPGGRGVEPVVDATGRGDDGAARRASPPGGPAREGR